MRREAILRPLFQFFALHKNSSNAPTSNPLKRQLRRDKLKAQKLSSIMAHLYQKGWGISSKLNFCRLSYARPVANKLFVCSFLTEPERRDRLCLDSRAPYLSSRETAYETVCATVKSILRKTRQSTLPFARSRISKMQLIRHLGSQRHRAPHFDEFAKP